MKLKYSLGGRKFEVRTLTGALLQRSKAFFLIELKRQFSSIRKCKFERLSAVE